MTRAPRDETVQQQAIRLYGGDWLLSEPRPGDAPELVARQVWSMVPEQEPGRERDTLDTSMTITVTHADAHCATVQTYPSTPLMTQAVVRRTWQDLRLVQRGPRSWRHHDTLRWVYADGSITRETVVKGPDTSAPQPTRYR